MIAEELNQVFTRRRLLAGALGVGSVLVLGGSFRHWLRRPAPDVAGLQVLSPAAYRTMVAVAHALFPRGGAFEHGADDNDIARVFDQFLANEPIWNQRDLLRALTLVELGPLLFERRPIPFHRLPRTEATHHLESWMTSHLLIQRQVITALRKFCSIVFYDDPSVWPVIGYDGAAARRWGTQP